MNNIDYSKILLLTRQEDAEWTANRLSYKQNLKRKVQLIKDSITARRDISAQDYRALLADRQRRMKLIEMARPIFMDDDKLKRVGYAREHTGNMFADLRNSDELNGGFTAAKEALSMLSEVVFTHGLTRNEFRQGAKQYNLTLADLEKAELCIDWVIWRMKPYMEILADQFGFDDVNDLTENRLAGILRVLDKKLTYYAPAPGKGGYQWSISKPEADRMVQVFPYIAQHIRDGIA